MLAAMNDAAALLCEEKMTKDKTETAAGDYEGMAKLLRAAAEAHTKSCQRDAALSRRLGRAMHRIGFRAETVSVYGSRRRVVVAEGVDLGGAPIGLHTGGRPVSDARISSDGWRTETVYDDAGRAEAVGCRRYMG